MSCLNCAKYHQLVSDYSYLQKKHAELKSERGWIRCEDGMPDKEHEFIVYDLKRGVTAAYFDKKFQYKAFNYRQQWVKVYEGCGEHVLLEQVTHWMTLPEAPVAVIEEKE